MSKINIQPLSDRVVIEPIAVETKTASGLYIPDSVQKEKSNQGIIVAVGKGLKDIPMTVKVGDKVMFGRFGSEIKINDKNYIIMRETDILAII